VLPRCAEHPRAAQKHVVLLTGLPAFEAARGCRARVCLRRDRNLTHHRRRTLTHLRSGETGQLASQIRRPDVSARIHTGSRSDADPAARRVIPTRRLTAGWQCAPGPLLAASADPRSASSVPACSDDARRDLTGQQRPAPHSLAAVWLRNFLHILRCLPHSATCTIGRRCVSRIGSRPTTVRGR
jgi:hypothetical protein